MYPADIQQFDQFFGQSPAHRKAISMSNITQPKEGDEAPKLRVQQVYKAETLRGKMLTLNPSLSGISCSSTQVEMKSSPGSLTLNPTLDFRGVPDDTRYITVGYTLPSASYITSLEYLQTDMKTLLCPFLDLNGDAGTFFYALSATEQRFEVWDHSKKASVQPRVLYQIDHLTLEKAPGFLLYPKGTASPVIKPLSALLPKALLEYISQTADILPEHFIPGALAETFTITQGIADFDFSSPSFLMSRQNADKITIDTIHKLLAAAFSKQMSEFFFKAPYDNTFIWAISDALAAYVINTSSKVSQPLQLKMQQASIGPKALSELRKHKIDAIKLPTSSVSSLYLEALSQLLLNMLLRIKPQKYFQTLAHIESRKKYTDQILKGNLPILFQHSDISEDIKTSLQQFNQAAPISRACPVQAALKSGVVSYADQLDSVWKKLLSAVKNKDKTEFFSQGLTLIDFIIQAFVMNCCIAVETTSSELLYKKLADLFECLNENPDLLNAQEQAFIFNYFSNMSERMKTGRMFKFFDAQTAQTTETSLYSAFEKFKRTACSRSQPALLNTCRLTASEVSAYSPKLTLYCSALSLLLTQARIGKDFSGEDDVLLGKLILPLYFFSRIQLVSTFHNTIDPRIKDMILKGYLRNFSEQYHGPQKDIMNAMDTFATYPALYHTVELPYALIHLEGRIKLYATHQAICDKALLSFLAQTYKSLLQAHNSSVGNVGTIFQSLSRSVVFLLDRSMPSQAKDLLNMSEAMDIDLLPPPTRWLQIQFLATLADQSFSKSANYPVVTQWIKSSLLQLERLEPAAMLRASTDYAASAFRELGQALTASGSSSQIPLSPYALAQIATQARETQKIVAKKTKESLAFADKIISTLLASPQGATTAVNEPAASGARATPMTAAAAAWATPMTAAAAAWATPMPMTAAAAAWATPMPMTAAAALPTSAASPLTMHYRETNSRKRSASLQRASKNSSDKDPDWTPDSEPSPKRSKRPPPRR